MRDKLKVQMAAMQYFLDCISDEDDKTFHLEVLMRSGLSGSQEDIDFLEECLAELVAKFYQTISKKNALPQPEVSN